MEVMSVLKVQALTRCLERLYSAESLKQFASRLFNGLGEIIKGGVFLLDTVNLKTGEAVRESSGDGVTWPQMRNHMIGLIPDSQVRPMVSRSGEAIIGLADHSSQWDFGQTSLWTDPSVPMNVRRQTVVALDIPGHVASLTVYRDRDFTEVESLLLTLAAPHVALAHRILQHLDSLRVVAAQVVPEPQDFQRVGLTPREAEVLHWVMKGKQDGAIAAILNISVRTVHQHIGHILKKLQSESRASAGYEAMMKLKTLANRPQTG